MIWWLEFRRVLFRSWTQGNAFNRDIDDSEYFSTAAELFTNLEHVLNHCYQGVIELLLAAINLIPE